MTAEFDALAGLLTARHSCRAFRPDPVPRDTIARILATAGRAPSWCNSQPWQVDVTLGAATEYLRAALLRAFDEGQAPAPDIPWPSRYDGVYRDRRRRCGFQLYDAVGIARDDMDGRRAQSRRNFALFDAPHCAVLSCPADLGPYGMMDCGGFIAAFTLAAQALGIASIPQAAIAGHAPVLRAVLHIPADRQIICGISFGHADRDHRANAFRTERAPLDEWVVWHDAD